MSRRGRGGYVGRTKAGHTRIAGSDFAVEEGIEETLKSRVQPAPLFPFPFIDLTGCSKSYKPAQPKPLGKVENNRVTKFLAIRQHFRDGPLFTVLDRRSKGSDFNPFEGMQAYSQKYTKAKRHLPDLKSQPRALQLIPKELWSAYGVSTTRPNGLKSQSNGPRVQKKKPADAATIDKLEEDEDGADNAEEAEAEEEEVDDEYDSEEDEMAGDYNAEQYFDDGGDDAGDDYDAGEGDGGDAFN